MFSTLAAIDPIMIANSTSFARTVGKCPTKASVGDAFAGDAIVIDAAPTNSRIVVERKRPRPAKSATFFESDFVGR
jgi:hypothetical protein